MFEQYTKINIKTYEINGTSIAHVDKQNWYGKSQKYSLRNVAFL